MSIFIHDLLHFFFQRKRRHSSEEECRRETRIPDNRNVELLEEALHAIEEALRLGIVLVAAFLEGSVELAQ